MNEEKIKLDLKDKKILTILDENARLSNSQIAKRVQLSKPAVEYRLRRFEKNNVIHSHYTVIDFTKLGYSQYKIYFKFQNITQEDEQNMANYWINDSNSMWVGQIRGRWDLAVSILAKSNYEFGKILNSFMKEYCSFVLEKDVLLTEYSPMYSREYLEKTSSTEFLYGVPSKIYYLDETDEIILKELAGNARIPIIDLANKINITRDIINYRMKKLNSEGIIRQYKTYLNLQNLNIKHYKIIIRTKNFNEISENRFKNYATNHKKSTQFLKLIGSWDLEIEFETESEDELYEILIQMRKDFSDIIRDYDIIRITETYKLNCFPF